MLNPVKHPHLVEENIAMQEGILRSAQNDIGEGNQVNITTPALVLRAVDYKESDKILTVLTAQGGKRTVKARGCRRKGSQLAAPTQLLVYSEMILFEYRDHFTLSEGATLNQFWGVRQDVEKLALASYFAEVVELVADEGHPDPALMALILNSLYALDKLQKPLALIKAAFELKLLCLAGYEPMLEGCALCDRVDPQAPRLDLSEGVLHCATCSTGQGISMPLDTLSLNAMRHVAYGDPKRLFSFPMDPPALERLANCTEAYLLTQLERGFHTLDFYKQFSLLGGL